MVFLEDDANDNEMQNHIGWSLSLFLNAPPPPLHVTRYSGEFSSSEKEIERRKKTQLLNILFIHDRRGINFINWENKKIENIAIRNMYCLSVRKRMEQRFIY